MLAIRFGRIARPSLRCDPSPLSGDVLVSPGALAILVEPGTRLLIRTTAKTKKGRLVATFSRLVEAAGIEPASASLPPSALHAYSVN